MKTKTISVLGVVVLLLAVAAGGQESMDGADVRALDQFIKGNAAAQQGNPYQAIYFFEEAIRYDSDSPFLYVALAEQYLVLADENKSSEAIERAEKALQQALSIDPMYEPALELQSRLLAARGNAREAERIVRLLLDRNPNSRGYQIDLLGLSLSTGSFDTVDSLYTEISKSDGENLDLTRRILAIYLVSGESKRAIPYLTELYNADTTDAGIVYTLSTLYLQSNDTSRALESVEEAIRLDSSDARFWYLRLVIEYEAERYDSVLRIAESARKSAGDDARTFNLEGLVHLRNMDSTRAKECFLRALELDSTLYPSAGSLALIYDSEDSVEQSERYYSIAMSLSDSAAIYLNNCAYMYAVRGLKLETAMSLVDEALKKEPENPSYLDTKAWIYFKQSRFKDALKWIKRALKHDPRSAPIFEHLGDIYEAMGKPSLASENWKTALELDPKNASVRQKLGE